MKTLKLSIMFAAVVLMMSSCRTPYTMQDDELQIETSKSVSIPKDGSGPIAGMKELAKPDRVVTFTGANEVIFVKNGEEVNFIYDGVDPEKTYVMYEATDGGYNLRLAYKADPVTITFKSLCQSYIVANPALTNCIVPENLKYEQIIWTPRKDGTWELRIGTVERGCKSQSLNDLQKLRTRDYDSKTPKMK